MPASGMYLKKFRIIIHMFNFLFLITVYGLNLEKKCF